MNIEAKEGAYLKRISGLFIRRVKVQTALGLLSRMQLRFEGFQLQKAGDLVAIPITHPPSAEDENTLRKGLGSFQIQEAFFEPISTGPRNLREAAQGKIPVDLIPRLPRSFDIVGDIAIIELPPLLQGYSTEVGKAVVRMNPHVRLVLSKSGEVTGRFRTRALNALTGTGSMETVHREFACSYHLDVSSVYFNPRLSHERRRVAEQVTQNEVVVDMFAGVGPYSILIATLQPAVKVYAVDINPSAVRYLKDNVLANKVADRVVPMLGDAREFSKEELKGAANRVVMNLPSDAEHYLDAALRILKSGGGVVHFYQFTSRQVGSELLKTQFRTSVLTQKREVKSFNYCKVVREVSPRRVQVALDAVIV